MMEKQKDTDQRSIETLFEELDQILAQMESGELSLDQTFSKYEAGIQKIKQCGAQLDLVEKKMLELCADGEVLEF